MKPTVLLIDDDASFREVMAYHLSEAGVEADLAVDEQKGLENSVQPWPLKQMDSIEMLGFFRIPKEPAMWHTTCCNP